MAGPRLTKKLSQIQEGERFTIEDEFHYRFYHPLHEKGTSRFNINLEYSCEFVALNINRYTIRCQVYIERFYCIDILILFNHKNFKYIKDRDAKIVARKRQRGRYLLVSKNKRKKVS